VQPRDPSSVDADTIDLRAAAADDPDGASRGGIGADEDGPDPDNFFSLGPPVARHSAPPPSGVMVRRRGEATAGEPLGPDPIPGPIDGIHGVLDLTDVGPAAAGEGPELLPLEPSRRRGWWLVVRLVASAGIIGIGTVVGAVLGAAGLDAWLVALVVAAVCVVLAAPLWSLRLARR